MQLPSLDEAKLLHKKYAPSKAAFDSVWGHSQIVRRIALQVVARHHLIDKDLVSTGALLHDIGVYELYEGDELSESRAYITHGLLGYKLLRAEGLDEAICRFALLHTGVGITTEDIKNQKLPLPLRDYLAETDEERIVMYADKFHSKTDPPVFNSANWYRSHLQDKLGVHKVNLFDEMVQEFGEPNLKPLMATYGHAIR